VTATIDEPVVFVIGGSGAAPVSPVRVPLTRRATRCVFRREGEMWYIAYAGDSFRLKHSKGLAYLAELLAHPGGELHALALAAPAAGSERLASAGMCGPGELLDRAARDAYRRRIEELSEELDEAERFGDIERAARARTERGFLAAELAAAVGLGGRGRHAPGPGERARQSVTKAIKSALRRIEDHSPALGRHLAATIRTGAVCTYRPDPRVPIEWRL
jgi:non-specific serine/threonine protein kinase